MLLYVRIQGLTVMWTCMGIIVSLRVDRNQQLTAVKVKCTMLSYNMGDCAAVTNLYPQTVPLDLSDY